MMQGKERRERIMDILKRTEGTIKGVELAEVFSVSRQVIVQDIALLRAQGERVISTSEGYLHLKSELATCKRVLFLSHKNTEIEEELMMIVDLGGHILNVIVEHPIYGEIDVDLRIHSRKQVEEFVRRAKSHDFIPLMQLTGGGHYHTIEAPTEEVLDSIEKALKERGFILET